MRKAIAAIALAAGALSIGAARADDTTPTPSAGDAAAATQPAPVTRMAPTKKRWRPGGFWVSLGINGAHVEAADKGCPGGQAALAFGSQLFVKLQRTSVTYEARDRTDTCDGLLVGDSEMVENALLVGVASRVNGLFLALGPARVHEDSELMPIAKDTGIRFELGWSSRHRRGSTSMAGIEVVGFATSNEMRNYHGLGLNMTFGEPGH